MCRWTYRLRWCGYHRFVARTRSDWRRVILASLCAPRSMLYCTRVKQVGSLCLLYAPCACSRVVRIDPFRFLAGCLKRRLNQALSLLTLIFLCVCSFMLFIMASFFFVLLVYVGICSVFWLFWLSYQYLPSDWLEGLLRGNLIVGKGSSLRSPGRRVFVTFSV